MTRKATALITAASLLAAPAAQAMGDAITPLRLGCRTESAKARVDDEICTLFLERVAARYPNHDLQLIGAGAGADLTLVLLDANAQSFTARVDHAQGPGEPLGTMRRGAPLDRAARAQLLDQLLAATPTP